jgi:hypothetical protein
MRNQTLCLKCFVVLLLFLTSSIVTYGQHVRFPNEVAGYQFYDTGRLKGIELAHSTRNDVIPKFGLECEWHFCDYDQKWDVMFGFMEDLWIDNTRVEAGIKYQLVPLPDSVGKLWVIRFRPKGPVSFSAIKLPSGFNKSSERDMHSGFQAINYSAANGLSYQVSDEEEDRGSLLDITYQVSRESWKKYFFVTEIENVISDEN